MIEKYGTEIEFVCDECGETHGPHEGHEFHDALAEAKSEGWTVFKEPTFGLWQHRCPACRGR